MEPYQLLWIYGEFLCIGCFFFCFFFLHQLCACVYIYSMCCCARVSTRMLSEVIRAGSISFYQVCNYCINHVDLLYRAKMKRDAAPVLSLCANLQPLLLLILSSPNTLSKKSNNKQAGDYATSWLKAAQIYVFT